MKMLRAPAVTKYEKPELARIIPNSVPMQSAAGVNVAVKGSIDMAADYVVILMIQFRKVSFNLGY